MQAIRVFIMSLCMAWVITSTAQVSGVHLSWGSNSRSATSKTMSFTWTSSQQDNAIVRYSTDSNKLNRSVRAKWKYSEYLNKYIFKAYIDKLKPGTRYYYRIGNAKDVNSSLFSFQTASSDKRSGFTVGVWSDTQDNNGNRSFEQTDTIVQQLASHPLHFTIHTGDIVENGSVVRSWEKFFATSEPLNANFPLMSVTGNHDVVNDLKSSDFQQPFPVFYELFQLGNNQLNYAYSYQNTRFIAINSGYAKGAEKAEAIHFKPGSEEYRWLEQELKNAKADKKVKWIIVYCHYPVYAYGVSMVSQWQQHLIPLLDKYKVDLCLSGHRHVYERHKAINGTTVLEMPDRNIYDRPQGTVYITNGSAGGSLQGTGGSNLPTMVYTPGKKIFTYGVMHINDEAIRFDVYDKLGQKIDYFSIKK